MDVAGVAAVDSGERPAQTIRVRRHEDEMDMVGHQHPGPDFDARRGAMVAQQITVERVIGIIKEGLGAPVAALRHMVRQAGKNRSGETRHGESSNSDPANADVPGFGRFGKSEVAAQLSALSP